MSNTTQRAKQAQYKGTVEELLRALDSNAVKSAETLSEPGSIGGSTTHPVASVDDRLQKATEGSRSSENSEDVKEDQPTAGVDSTSEGTPGGQESVQLDVGITSKATGEDPSAETDKAKGGKEDPGSSHPARTDNDELDGSKYSSTYEFYEALCKKAQADGNDLLATITVEADAVKKAQAQARAPAAPAAKNAPAAKQAETVEPEAPVEDADPAFDKQAADAIVVNAVANTIRSSHGRAVKVAEYLTSYFETIKRAEEEEAADPAPGGESAPPAEAAPAPGPEAGGLPPEAGAGGGGEAGGGGGDDLAMLAQILQETGMTPEDLIELIASAHGGGGADPMGGAGGAGGPPMGGGGMPAPGPEAMMGGAGAPPVDPMAAKAAAARKGQKWQAKTAADRAKYAKVKGHLMELYANNKR